MLRLDNVVKDFVSKEQTTHVLKGISIQFRKSEFVSILGHSGCGKTTLLNMIGGLDTCTAGAVYLDGKSTREYNDADWNLYRNKRIGFVFQSYNLIHHLSIEKNVELPLALSEVPKEERKRRALEALERVGLRDHARKHPNQLSGGQMQRVAIARALVNNPSIILADEPTGALDSESGIQVMELLREVAKDKLVIMVTHNDSLAEEYSTRIISMSDGKIKGDTDPYTLEECLREEKAEANKKHDEREKLISENTTNEKERKRFLRKLKQQEYEKRMKTSMSLGTAISMSITNLRSKLGRSLLTSIAGSIGIIGIMLVLALSTGVKGYISGIEENALSQYPVTINDTNMDLMGAMSVLTGAGKNDRDEYPKTDEVYVQSVIGSIAEVGFNSFFNHNDLAALKEYIDENFDENLGYVKYNYGVTMDIYFQCEGEERYTLLYPFAQSIKGVVGDLPITDTIEKYGGAVSSWDELIDNRDLLNSQYDLVGKNSRWPSAWNELVLVVDDKNQLNDYELFILGLLSPSKVLDMLSISDILAGNAAEPSELAQEVLSKVYTVDELLKLEYKVLSANDYYQKVDGTERVWKEVSDDTKTSLDFVNDNGDTLKVVGVVRPKEGASVTCINGCIAYTSDLVKHMGERAKAKEGTIVNAYYKNEGYNPEVAYNPEKPAIGLWNEEERLAFLRKYGVAALDTPKSINVYASSFENKDKILAFLDKYNELEQQKENASRPSPDAEAEYTAKTIKYSDNLSMIMSYVDMLTDTITKVLVGFAAISLVVSSIMIAIITYTSVLERRKEIGILRSVGARKLDISNVFISESGLLGVSSGLLGTFITWLLTLLANFILKLMLNVKNLAIITWWSPIVMVAISVLLSFLAGFLPARIAANKDPVECLRSE